MHELVFQASVKGTSLLRELISCIYMYSYVYVKGRVISTSYVAQCHGGM